MNEIADIIAGGPSFTDETARIPSADELRDFETAYSLVLPDTYKQFVELGGLRELAFDERVLAPDEMVVASQWLPDHLLPFAENGCGDTYCWLKPALPDSSVVFWDHETMSESEYLPSFLDCVRQWRRV